MSIKFGFPALTNRASNGNKPKKFSKSNNQPLIIRVTDIIMDENHPFIMSGKYGLDSLGLIFGVGNSPSTLGKTFTALPLNPNNKKYPIINEQIILIETTSPNSSKTRYFYQEPIGFFGSSTPNGNPYPSITFNPTPISQQFNYSQIEAGAVNIESNKPTILPQPISNPSQNNFVEKSNIHPLMPFEGHIMYEGRYGQSIRFGSTSKSNSKYANNWSTSGNNGDPITILRNGQPKITDDAGYIPITENINGDLSSIYLSSYQKIPIGLSNENFNSYKTPPILPSQFNLPQVIINSERIILNAKKDSVLISAQKYVGLSSNESINIESKQTYIASNDIRLGSKNATQPVLKGDDTIELLKQLTKTINDLATILQVEKNWPGGVLVTGFNSIAGNALITLENISEQLDNNSLKSKTTKVQ